MFTWHVVLSQKQAWTEHGDKYELYLLCNLRMKISSIVIIWRGIAKRDGCFQQHLFDCGFVNKIGKIQNIHFVGNLILNMHGNFLDDDVMNSLL